jgi:predicted NUDIX family NTP pyrophosphohydrolase
LSKQSAGILLYRVGNAPEVPQVLLVHPGGPFHAKRDAGAWSIPKGEFLEGEDPLEAAKREFAEELGSELVASDLWPLQPIKQKGGKVVHAWAGEGAIDVTTVKSNTCTVQWPPGSGKMIEIPEVDRAEWFGFRQAREKINPAQVALIDELESMLK